MEIGTIFDSSGVDICFLNRRPIYNVIDPEVVDEVCSIPSLGYTPLIRALKYIFELPSTRRGNDKKNLYLSQLIEHQQLIQIISMSIILNL